MSILLCPRKYFLGEKGCPSWPYVLYCSGDVTLISKFQYIENQIETSELSNRSIQCKRGNLPNNNFMAVV